MDPHINGQCVEHLGRGVYEGIWVGRDSPIPSVRGIRSDVVAARLHGLCVLRDLGLAVELREEPSRGLAWFRSHVTRRFFPYGLSP
jgi:hypothetical protein